MTYLFSERLEGCDIDTPGIWGGREHPQDGKLSTDGLPTARRSSDKHVIISVVEGVEHCKQSHLVPAPPPPLPPSLPLFPFPFTAPYQSPTQIYISDIQPTSIMLHWTYDETPPTGLLIQFRLDIYFQDINFPDRINNDRPFSENLRIRVPSGGSLIRVTDFSELIMNLLPGTSYVASLSAVTNAGEGPRARFLFTTQRAGTEMHDS